MSTSDTVLTAPDGSQVRAWIVWDEKCDAWSVVVDGVNCALDGIAPGVYLLVPEVTP